MELTINRKDLIEALNIVVKARASRGTLPILTMFALRAELDGLHVMATDLESFIRQRVDAEVRAIGGLCVRPLLVEFLGQVGGDEVVLRRSYTAHKLLLDCERSKAEIATMDIDEFPAEQECDQHVATISSELLNQLVRRTAFSAATDESRPILTGIKLEMADGKLTMAAADGFRLAVSSATVGNESEFYAVIPARGMGLLSAFRSGDISISIPERGDVTRVMFAGNDLSITLNTLLGKFPDYRMIIPEVLPTSATANRHELLRAARIAGMFARDAANIVKLELGDYAVRVSGAASEGDSGLADVSAEVTNPGLTIAFNGKYLTDALASIPGDEVLAEFGDPGSPAMFRRPGETDSLGVVMPMHLTR